LKILPPINSFEYFKGDLNLPHMPGYLGNPNKNPGNPNKNYFLFFLRIPEIQIKIKKYGNANKKPGNPNKKN
jgi:hypothetical protein